MPEIADAAAAKKLRDTVISQRDYTRTRHRRKIRDRDLQTELKAFKAGLSENIQKAFVPWMDQEPDAVVRKIKHTLISNPIEIEAIARDSAAIDQDAAQDYEIAQEGILEQLVPVNVQLLEQDGALGDGWAIYCIEQMPTTELAPYADHDGLKKYAEGDDPDDDDARSPRMQYRTAYREASTKRTANPSEMQPGDAHDDAYKSVTDAARRSSEQFPWRARVVNNLATWVELGKPGEIEWGLEDGLVPVSAIKQALDGYGYHMDETGHWKLKTKDGKPTDAPAFLVGEMQEHSGQANAGEADKLVRYTRIATKDQIAIFVEHATTDNDDTDPGVLATFPNPFGGKYCGYVLVPGDERNRPTWEERFVPPVEGMYVISFMKAYANSAAFAMLAEEAMRDVTAVKPTAKVAPLGTDQQGKTQIVKQGQAVATVAELQRTPSTGIAVLELAEMLDRQQDRFRFNSISSGVGSSGDSGIAQARLQTDYLTELQPYQQKRALAYKQMLQMIATATAQGDKPLYIPYMPRGMRGAGDDIQVAEIRELTPEMARMPIDIRVTIGAESPETKFAREQALRAQQDAKVISRTTVQEGSGVKDPKKENRRIAKDAVFQMLIAGDGETPGSLVSFIASRIQQRVQERIDRRLPAPPAALSPSGDASAMVDPQAAVDPAMAGGDGGDPAILQGPGPVTGAARLPNPVQTNEAGVPISGAANAISQ